ncbi:MAG: pantoate--beta-alanine ligase, partial [Holophagales bacterium]|nr:pantoate--beta-alanine ligase [Holophagales bacterium]
PSVETMYPEGESTFVDAGAPALGFEGDERPGHFRGVATVVAKLFHLVQPDVAIFGQKDAQQLAVVGSMVRDLHMPVKIVGAPIVRDPDGLAMSSRNVYLSPAERQAAAVLFRSLTAAREAVEAGERSAEAVRLAVLAHLDAETRGSTDYVAVVDADSFAPLDSLEERRVTVAIAFRLGRTRLLDNIVLDLRGQARPVRGRGTESSARGAGAVEPPNTHSVRESAPATF